MTDAKLCPREPPQAMEQAGLEIYLQGTRPAESLNGLVMRLWRAMYDAAPAQPAPPAGLFKTAEHWNFLAPSAPAAEPPAAPATDIAALIASYEKWGSGVHPNWIDRAAAALRQLDGEVEQLRISTAAECLEWARSNDAHRLRSDCLNEENARLTRERDEGEDKQRMLRSAVHHERKRAETAEVERDAIAAGCIVAEAERDALRAKLTPKEEPCDTLSPPVDETWKARR